MRPAVRASFLVIFGLLLCAGPSALIGADTNAPQAQVLTEGFAGWTTNGDAVFRKDRHFFTNFPMGLEKIAKEHPEFNLYARFPPKPYTNQVFSHYVPKSLHYVVWTNFCANTNGKNQLIWSVRVHPDDWPKSRPRVQWNTNSMMWGMRGITAFSPCWEGEGNSGQVPITALSRRHGYTRGHGMGPEGFRTLLAGKKVWFLSTNNVIVEMKIAREVVRTMTSNERDYTLVLFDRDLPMEIQPIAVMDNSTRQKEYEIRTDIPCPFFETEQSGFFSANMLGFRIDVRKGGDSGSPNLLPLPGELVFCGGRTTSAPSAEMQADMDELCRLEGLNFNEYQLRWYDLAGFKAAQKGF